MVVAVDRREIKRQFKQRTTEKGIYAVRCSASGEAWVSSSRDLNASRTGIWFMLRNGSHHNKKIQAAWSAHGAESFEFVVLENFDDGLEPLLLADMLRDRQKKWARELGAAMV